MVEAVRTPDERFEGLDWPFEPHYFTHDDPSHDDPSHDDPSHDDSTGGGLRQHYVDERPTGAERGTFLLLHGEPTWSYLYRDWIGPLVERGYRVVAPDHLGFGRSDKPVDDEWYTIARHRQAHRELLAHLDLHDIHLVVQDWAGPIGLMTAMADLDRYARIFILNTWLHDDTFEYSDGIRWWRQAALDPDQLGGDMPIGDIVAGTLRRGTADVHAVRAAFDAPYPDARSKAGARRFPFCIPFAEPGPGDAAEQIEARAVLRTGPVPVHVAFGDADPVFTWEWAEQWAGEIDGATLDRIPGAGHFVQIDAPDDCLAVVTAHLR